MPIVVGVDPGTHRFGWGVIGGSNQKQNLIASGCIESTPHTPVQIYLTKIKKELDQILAQHKPDFFSIETLLFQKNLKTATTVAQARGVALLSAAEHHLEIIEIAPNTIKSAVAGSGSAGKAEVNRMVSLLLHIDTGGMLDDTADALAAAIAGLVTHGKLKSWYV